MSGIVDFSVRIDAVGTTLRATAAGELDLPDAEGAAAGGRTRVADHRVLAPKNPRLGRGRHDHQAR